VPAEDRRLAAEEGSYSLKTWLRKTHSPRLGELQYWAPASPVVSPLLSPLSLDGHGWSVPLDPLIHQPPEPAVHLTFPGRGPKTGSRRRIALTEDLAAED